MHSLAAGKNREFAHGHSALLLSLSAQFGGMLAAVELGMQPIAPWVRSNLHYVATPPGRTALLAFLGGLTWPLGKMGLVPALLTCFNAVFNANFNPLLAYLSADDAQTAASRRAAAATRNVQVAAAAAEAEAAAAEAASAAGAQAGAQAALNAAQAAEKARAAPDVPAGEVELSEADLAALKASLEAQQRDAPDP